MSKALPAGWRLCPLSELATLDVASLNDRCDPDYGFYYVDISSVRTGRISRSTRKIRFADAPSRARKLIRRGDVLMSTVRPNLKAFAFVEDDADDVVCSTGFAVLTANNEVSGRFLYHSILSDVVSSQINAFVAGSNYPAINSKQVREIVIPRPPLAEQKKIAAILTSVDDVIEKTEAQIQKLEDLKKATMNELLTKGIGHTEFKDSPVGGIPKEWSVLRLGDAARKVTDGTHQPVKVSQNGNIPFLYVSCIRNGRIDWDKSAQLERSEYEKASKGKILDVGDVLYTAVGSYGNAAVVEVNREFTFQRHIAQIKPNPDVLYSRFLCLYLNSKVGKRQADGYAVGNAQLTVTLGDLARFQIPVPPLEEQTEIAQMYTAIEQQIHAQEKRVRALHGVKSALMGDLLTGKVRVPLT